MNMAAEGRNRWVFGDIGNMVTLQGAEGKQQLRQLLLQIEVPRKPPSQKRDTGKPIKPEAVIVISPDTKEKVRKRTASAERQQLKVACGLNIKLPMEKIEDIDVADVYNELAVVDFRSGEHLGIIGYAWDIWDESKPMNLMHPSLSDSCVPEEVLRCMHLALLCVQDLAVHRPNISVVLFLETDNLTLPLPRPPTYTSMRRVPETEVWNQTGDIPSFNNITISMIVEYCTAEYTLTQSQRLSVNQSLVSAGGMFELGFFSPGNSRKLYVGLWYKNVPARSILWVANRENPLVANDSASSLKIGRDGNLRLVDGEQTTVWSTNVSIHSSSNTTAVLTDIGELILKESSTGLLLWNSFDYPTDTIIPGMNLGYDVRDGVKQELSSWESENDPSPGKFRVGLSQETPPQAFTWINNSTPYWRSGPWNGWKFIGIPEQYTGYSNGMNLIQDNNPGTAYFSFNAFNRSYVLIGTIRPSGLLQINLWDDKMNAWDLNWEAPNHLCDVYGTCGPFSVCDKTKSPFCVQDYASDRPTMSNVVLMLCSETDIPRPKQPTFTIQTLLGSDSRTDRNNAESRNEISVSVIEGRLKEEQCHREANRMERNWKLFAFSVLCALILLTEYCTADDTLTRSRQLSVNQSLVSAGEVFELGFFSPGRSRKLYIGLWHKNITVRRILWVANRENPLLANDSAASLKIGSDGNIRLVDGKQKTVWSTNVSSIQSNSSTIAVLTDKGELILRDTAMGVLLWNSFNYPCDTIISGMSLGYYDILAGVKRELSSWKSEDDPSPRNFTVGLSQENPPQVFTWGNNSKPYWRSGPWNGWRFIGIPGQASGYAKGMNLVQDNNQGTAYLSFNMVNASYIVIISIKPSGSLQMDEWNDKRKEWVVDFEAPDHICDVYGTCGPFSVCDKKKSPFCECLRGFIPKSREEWSKGNWTGGCVRRTELLCEPDRSSMASKNSKNDMFLNLTEMKLPDRFIYLFDQDMEGCRQWCLENCSCVAYAFPQGIGCMVWTSSLIDVLQFSLAGEDLYLRLSSSEFGEDKRRIALIAGLTTVTSSVILGILIYMTCIWRANRKGGRRERIKDLFFIGKARNGRDITGEELQGIHAFPSDSSELPMIGFDELAAATNDFSNDNKLGAGGFGSVYKGILGNGQEIAVKRLSAHSGQGVEEFKNEILLISKLQHRNLVRLLGCSIHGEEKLLGDRRAIYSKDYGNLAWQLWSESREVELIDESITNSCSFTEALRCIRIGLLCVQDHVSDRPTMSNVVLMLCSETEIPQPKQPTFTIQSFLDSDSKSHTSNAHSNNETTPADMNSTN
nr:G-type lectin S-receptor-like serine/threonine-protein kinase At1g61370 [Ipomoea trifida]